MDVGPFFIDLNGGDEFICPATPKKHFFDFRLLCCLDDLLIDL